MTKIWLATFERLGTPVYPPNAFSSRDRAFKWLADTAIRYRLSLLDEKQRIKLVKLYLMGRYEDVVACFVADNNMDEYLSVVAVVVDQSYHDYLVPTDD